MGVIDLGSSRGHSIENTEKQLVKTMGLSIFKSHQPTLHLDSVPLIFTAPLFYTHPSSCGPTDTVESHSTTHKVFGKGEQKQSLQPPHIHQKTSAEHKANSVKHMDSGGRASWERMKKVIVRQGSNEESTG